MESEHDMNEDKRRGEKVRKSEVAGGMGGACGSRGSLGEGKETKIERGQRHSVILPGAWKGACRSAIAVLECSDWQVTKDWLLASPGVN